MANECIPLYDDGDYVPMLATVAVTGKRFVDITGAQDSTFNVFQAALPSAGGKVVGVAAYDAASGAVFNTVRRGGQKIVPVTAAGTIAVGDDVMVDATGAVVAWTTGNVAVGRAYTAATTGNDVFITMY